MEVLLKKFFKSISWLLVIATFIIIIDQLTKYFIRQYMVYGETWAPWDWMMPYARLLYIHNTGAAFGLFKDGNPIFMALAVIVSGVIIYYYPQVPKEEKVIRFALSLQLAGAVGNLIDRIFFGRVTDFISVGNFAIFNVADSSITVGVIILLIAVWWQDRNEKKKLAAAKLEEPVNEFGSEN
ncbi:MAG TPA: signal peptidase II [Anaerolineaceae bacterium]|nr:signal peptidase II [Anaerolineaceae bacterium]